MNLVILICFLVFTRQAQGLLRCYICSMSENDVDTGCLDNPAKAESGKILDCDKKFCYSVRQDYKDPKGKLKSLTRTCLDVPLFINDVIEDDTYRY
ncbi:unnamed protein product [Acanthoscelides obtectus]|nr:unnamed protein product [Acanthoscelides obtectus]CAK1657071.1 hypothetical protein AOBTE_LOCUS20100 [Acanthoscelides obtectus]